MVVGLLFRINGNSTTLASGQGDRIGLHLEESHKVSVSFSNEHDGSLARILLTILRPANKGVGLIGSGGQGDFSAFSKAASASDRTTFDRISNGGDGVHRDDGLDEVGDEGHVFGDIEGIGRLDRDFLTIHGPVEEVVTLIGGSNDSDLITKMIRTIGDGSFTAQTSLNGDGIVDQHEVSNIFGIASNHDGIFSIGADHLFTQRPVDK